MTFGAPLSISDGVDGQRQVRRTVESVPAIDVFSLRAHGVFQSDGPMTTVRGVATWKGDARSLSAEFVVEKDTLGYPSRLKLEYVVDNEVVSGEAELTFTVPCFRGRRWWLRCPSCGRRCAALFLLERLCTCRLCGKLAYRSTRQTDHARLLDQARKVKQRLGPSCRRPPRMRIWTYQELLEKHKDYELKALRALLRQKRIQRLLDEMSEDGPDETSTSRRKTRSPVTAEAV